MVMHISLPPSHYQVHSLQWLFFFCKPSCLTVLMHLLPGHLRTAIYLIKQTDISPLDRNSTKSCTDLISPKRPAQVSYGVITQPRSRHPQVVAMSLFQLSWVYNQAAMDPLYQYCPCSLPDNISSSRPRLTTACCSSTWHSQMRRFCSRKWHAWRSWYGYQEPG